MLNDQRYLHTQLISLNKMQRLLARSLLSTGWTSKRSLACMLEYAGEEEITSVLIEAGYQSLPRPAKDLALRLVKSSSITKNDHKARKTIQQLGWFNKGQHVLRDNVLEVLRHKLASGVI